MPTRKPAIVDRLMGEPVRLAGAPDIVLTRHAAYQFYVGRCGLDPHARGFASPDFLAFGTPTTTELLTDLTEPWAIQLMDAVAAA